MHITVTYHHSNSIVHQGGRGIQTGGVFTHIQSGPEKKKHSQKPCIMLYAEQCEEIQFEVQKYMHHSNCRVLYHFPKQA